VIWNYRIFNGLSLARRVHSTGHEALNMTRIRTRAFPGTLPSIGLILLAAAGIAAAQDQQPAPPQTQNPATGGWRRFNDPAPAQAAPAPDPEPVDRSGEPSQTPPQANVPPTPPANHPPAYVLPPELTLKPGTFVSVRTNEMLSSNRNMAGDSFSAVLMQPLVVDGVVVAQRGQTVYGRVAQAQKSHATTPSSLALELTGLTLVDGTQAPLQSQLVSWQGGKTPAGLQAGTVIGTTAVGAGIGAAVGWGTGAAIGGGAGLAVGAIATLVTRNHPTVVYPETAMTFRINAPLVVSTANAPQAFRYVSPNDYARQAPLQARTGPPAGPYSSPYAPYGQYYAPYPYGIYPYGYWGPYYGGVGFGIGFGRGFRGWR